MAATRSADNVFIFGNPRELNSVRFPTHSDIVSHASYLRKENINSGLWKVNVSGSEVAKVVANHVCEIWNKTEIPHWGRENTKKVKEKVENILVKSKEVLKIPVNRRKSAEMADSWEELFDISLCPHKAVKKCQCPFCESPHLESCDCSPDRKVPENWRGFLVEQRSKRTQTIGSPR